MDASNASHTMSLDTRVVRNGVIASHGNDSVHTGTIHHDDGPVYDEITEPIYAVPFKRKASPPKQDVIESSSERDIRMKLATDVIRKGRIKPSLKNNRIAIPQAKHIFDSAEETWDLRDSIDDLYREVNRRSKAVSSSFKKNVSNKKVEVKTWISTDTSNGFIRVFSPETQGAVSHLIPCTLATSAQRICYQCGLPQNSLHIQLNGDIIRRLEPYDCPLAIQNEYLMTIGYENIHRIQEEGATEELSYLIRFYAGKPYHDSTYARLQLTNYLNVRKGKILYQWVRRLCVISGTRLLIHREKPNSGKPLEVQLAKGAVEEMKVKGHPHVLKLTSTLQGERSVYLSFPDEGEYSRWLRKAKKATSKLPSKADLSHCHLEFLPETIFINEGLRMLNLRHNALKERPIEEDIYVIGWLDDLPKFYNLQSLNLADNDLHQFPVAVCQIKSMKELNLSTNKIDEIPYEIVELKNLELLHIHNNHLTSLPEGLIRLRKLRGMVLAFNRFSVVPNVILNFNHIDHPNFDSLIMAGNLIERLAPETLHHMDHFRRIDFRMNRLTLPPSEMTKLASLEFMTHLDVRDNEIPDMDIRSLKLLEYLNCERNNLKRLQVSGVSLKNLFCAYNELESISVNPKPEWLATMDISHNHVIQLPDWVPDCFFLVKLNASYNRMKRLPKKMLANCQKLKVFHCDNNSLVELPKDVNAFHIEELFLHNNQLMELPDNFLQCANKLRVLNITNNCVLQLPVPHENSNMNRIQELYLTGNQLQNDSLVHVCRYLRLKTLHIAHNNLTDIVDSDLGILTFLQELNISGNRLKFIPDSLLSHPKLEILRANSNLIRVIPDFSRASALKVLEVGSNSLLNLSMTSLASSRVNLLDVSGNPNLQVDIHELDDISVHKNIRTVDMTGKNRILQDLSGGSLDSLTDESDVPWEAGFSQTSGIRNKLSVKVLSKIQLSMDSGGLFAVVDGGRTNEICNKLVDILPKIMMEERASSLTPEHYLKYTILSMHKSLRALGQKLGASLAMCHITSAADARGCYELRVANVGDVEVVVCRRSVAVCVTRKFSVSSDRDECKRIMKRDGIITEDGRVNGITHTTRAVGSTYLYPHMIPNPHTNMISLQPDDEFMIIGSQGLWQYIDYQAAVDEIKDILEPVAAAKKLQDLAQAYGSKENIGVLVVRLYIGRDRSLTRLKSHDEDDGGDYAVVFDDHGGIPIAEECSYDRESFMGSNTSISTNASEFEPLRFVVNNIQVEKHIVARSQRGIHPSPMLEMNRSAVSADDLYKVQLKPLPNQRFRKKQAATEWENILQDRLSDDVKTKEMEHIWRGDDDDIDASVKSVDTDEDNGTNWSTLGTLKPKASGRTVKFSGEDDSNAGSISGRVVEGVLSRQITSPPWDPEAMLTKAAVGDDDAEELSPVVVPETPPAELVFSDFQSEDIFFDPEGFATPYSIASVDRDALLFHNMQRAQIIQQGGSSHSLSSVKSVPGKSSADILLSPQHRLAPASHSIEVIIRDGYGASRSQSQIPIPEVDEEDSLKNERTTPPSPINTTHSTPDANGSVMNETKLNGHILIPVVEDEHDSMPTPNTELDINSNALISTVQVRSPDEHVNSNHKGCTPIVSQSGFDDIQPVLTSSNTHIGVTTIKSTITHL